MTRHHRDRVAPRTAGTPLRMTNQAGRSSLESAQLPLQHVVRSVVERARREAARGLPSSAKLITGSPERVWEVMAGLRATVRYEYLSLDDPSLLAEAAVPEEIVLLDPQTLRLLITRDVAVRQITTRDGLAADQQLGTILWHEGSDTRVVDRRLPLTACVLDRRIVVVPLDLAVAAHGLLITSDREILDRVMAEHRALWASGHRPDASAEPPDDDGLPVHLVPLLPLLRDGVNDEAGARRMRLSPRTYSRRVKELLDLLGVRSRFAAGAEATRRNWL